MNNRRRIDLLTEVRVTCTDTHCAGCEKLTLARDQGGLDDPTRVLCSLFQQWPTPDSSRGFKRLPVCLASERRASTKGGKG